MRDRFPFVDVEGLAAVREHFQGAKRLFLQLGELSVNRLQLRQPLTDLRWQLVTRGRCLGGAHQREGQSE